MTAYHLALQRQVVLREIQLKLDWLLATKDIANNPLFMAAFMCEDAAADINEDVLTTHKLEYPDHV